MGSGCRLPPWVLVRSGSLTLPEREIKHFMSFAKTKKQNSKKKKKKKLH